MSSFGARLKQEREQRGVTLDQISQSTKIGVRLLRALEEEKFDQLPGGIFNKGFIRAYARFIGLDEEQAIADYLLATGVDEKKPETDEQAQITEVRAQEARTQELRTQAETQEPANLPWGAFAIVLLIIAVGFTVWGFYSREGREQHADSAPSGLSSSHQSGIGVASQTEPNSVAPSPTSSTPSGTLQTIPTSSSPESGSPDSAPSASAFVVVIKAREDTWVSISVDGEVTIRNNLVAPAEKTVRAQREIVIKAGNVGALEFEFNGKTLPTQGKYDEVKTLTFRRRGLQPVAPPNQAPAELQ